MKRFSNILFVAHPGADDTEALGQAVTLANNNQSKLTVVGHVDASDKEKAASDIKTTQLLEAMVEQRRDELDSLIASTSKTGSENEVKVLVGRGYLEIIRKVVRHERDLLIKSAEPIDGIVQSFSSTDMKLLRKCPCPIWVIKSTQQKGYLEILAALDYDPDDSSADLLNGQILEMATSLTLANFAELHIIHAWRLPHEGFLRSPRSGLSGVDVDEMMQSEESTRRQWLEALVNKHCAAQGKEAVDFLKPKIHLPQGDASHLVPELANELGAELVVMGTVGRTGIPGMVIGNTAETILRRIDSSVLAVKPAGFVSPVTLPL
jgi:nucleotide-binding universal stress UspA family protein